ncbi:MAG TPA: hypothetical protein PLI97_11580 [Fluviicola sp.]|nr:hypothetical protein [Fluviicola sp.]
MKRLLIYCILSLLIVNKPFAQKEYNKILLEHATIHIGNGEVIPTGLVGIENGKITLIKNSLAYTVDRSLWAKPKWSTRLPWICCTKLNAWFN